MTTSDNDNDSHVRTRTLSRTTATLHYHRRPTISQKTSSTWYKLWKIFIYSSLFTIINIICTQNLYKKTSFKHKRTFDCTSPWLDYLQKSWGQSASANLHCTDSTCKTVPLYSNNVQQFIWYRYVVLHMYRL